MSDEWNVRDFLREEEFLEEFYCGGAISAIRKILGDAWVPAYNANDTLRANAKYALDRGYFQDRLFFDFAAVYHTREKMFSSLQVGFRSANRMVTVRVRVAEDGDGMIAEKIVDQPIGPAGKASP